MIGGLGNEMRTPPYNVSEGNENLDEQRRWIGFRVRFYRTHNLSGSAIEGFCSQLRPRLNLDVLCFLNDSRHVTPPPRRDTRSKRRPSVRGRTWLQSREDR